MNMLNRLHEWLDEKTCAELDDRRLARRVRTAYRHVEPPTPADDLFAQLRARAEKTPQLAPEARRAETPKPSLATLRKRTEQERLIERSNQRRRSRHYGDHYRQIMDYALNQMRMSLLDAGMRLL
ncbi:MAG: hypothetical protein L0154_03010 [Chloroflexi bacterium]|nr:hypothetical protein [Chloroflexota bacterium]